MDSVGSAEFVQAQVEAIFPYVSSRQVTTDWDPKTFWGIVPSSCDIIRKNKMNYQTIVLARDENMMVQIRHVHKEAIYIAVCARSFEVADRTAEELLTRVPVLDPPDNVVSLNLWYHTPNGSNCLVKRIDVPSWEEITVNYPPATLAPLQQLMAMDPPRGTAKLILWHGDPGVGKTFALRALAREWNSWVKVHYITDPEKIFTDPGYLLEVSGTADKKEWQLIICEDSDEFLQASAKKEAGAALGRLLNFSDGILGQGTKTMILLTTNEPVNKLHPAVVRPGRCLAQIEFVRFTADQADRWLASHDHSGRVNEDTTLAELINRAGNAVQIANGVSQVEVGTYL